jgi:hypothetical protein
MNEPIETIGIHLGHWGCTVAVRRAGGTVVDVPLTPRQHVVPPVVAYDERGGNPTLGKRTTIAQGKSAFLTATGWLGSMGSSVPLLSPAGRPRTPQQIAGDFLGLLRTVVAREVAAPLAQVPLALVVPDHHAWYLPRRDAYLAAAREAGFHRVRVLSPALAIACAHDRRHRFPPERAVLVADAGSTALDLTLFTTRGQGRFALAAIPLRIQGLGGQALNRKMLDDLRARGFLRHGQHEGEDETGRLRASLLRLETALEHFRWRVSEQGADCLGIDVQVNLAQIEVRRPPWAGDREYRQTLQDLETVLAPERASLPTQLDTLLRGVGLERSDLAGLLAGGGGFLFRPMQSLFRGLGKVSIEANCVRSAARGAAWCADRPDVAMEIDVGESPAPSPVPPLPAAIQQTSLDGWLRLEKVLPNSFAYLHDPQVARALLRYNRSPPHGVRIGYADGSARLIAEVPSGSSPEEIRQRADLLDEGQRHLLGTSRGVPSPSLSSRERKARAMEIDNLVRRLWPDGRCEGRGSPLVCRLPGRPAIGIGCASWGLLVQQYLAGELRQPVDWPALLRWNVRLAGVWLSVDERDRLILQGMLLPWEITSWNAERLLQTLRAAGQHLPARLASQGVIERDKLLLPGYYAGKEENHG